MLKKEILLIGFVISLSLVSIAQETLKIMQYNLLYYGKDVYDCDQTTNNRDNKNTQLQTILAYVQPDIFCVNEMDASLGDVNYLMDNVLNIGTVNYWEHATVSGSYSINMLYYNSNIFTLNSQQHISASPRQTDVYHLTHIASSTDFVVFVAHLKAGSYTDDEEAKANATQNVMDYIASQGAGNYIFMGDLNLYSSSSEAFQNLINPSNSSIAFYDPVNRIGNWSNNSSYADVHTQSTHTSGSCFVTGGMDDRFDFIMISEDIKDGNNQIQYLENSYETIGQDGNHYNDALTDGTNNSAPSSVINALYNMSDHLPVSMELFFGTPLVPSTVFNKTFDDQSISSEGWLEYSVLDSERLWYLSAANQGHNNSYCAKISGWDYDNYIAVDNEDWLISPTFNAEELSQEILTFWTAGKYTGNDLQVYYSSNYSGAGDPNSANWTEITGFNLSTDGDFIWESSGDIDLSQIMGENVRIGFKYTSNPNAGARQWQIDDILLMGISSDASIADLQTENIKLFPNPVSKGNNAKLRIVGNKDSAHSIHVQIYDLTGKQIMDSEIEKGNSPYIVIETDQLEKGIYLVKIENLIKKLIVE